MEFTLTCGLALISFAATFSEEKAIAQWGFGASAVFILSIILNTHHCILTADYLKGWDTGTDNPFDNGIMIGSRTAWFMALPMGAIWSFRIYKLPSFHVEFVLTHTHLFGLMLILILILWAHYLLSKKSSTASDRIQLNQLAYILGLCSFATLLVLV